MPQPGTRSQVLHHIHQYGQLEDFEELPLLIGKAFKQAYDDSKYIKSCSLLQSRKRGQDRYYYVQEALHSSQRGWSISTQRADNSGESITQLETKNLLITTHVRPWHSAKMRPAKFRDQNAKHNTGIHEQICLALDSEAEINKAKKLEKLNIQIIALGPHPTLPQDTPAEIKVCVPFENNKGYHLDIPIDELLAGFSTVEPATEPADKALPTLRKKMRQTENDAEQRSQNE
ncbi:MAG: hypothetical protein IBX50_19670 [Marinospirillum sp.]|uniref:hypothetical protein n=1 Tax=Marinospirillum sp. TaxID=2183934 RepID=UPI0019EDBE99|nr:hypothetical protein [Marinospirillum sp.]MBE0508909.1 hypothetical protein [Marinospirillum sp.]